MPRCSLCQRACYYFRYVIHIFVSRYHSNTILLTPYSVADLINIHCSNIEATRCFAALSSSAYSPLISYLIMQCDYNLKVPFLQSSEVHNEKVNFGHEGVGNSKWREPARVNN